MCLLHPEGYFDCSNRYRVEPCPKVITFDPVPATVSDCFRQLDAAGWVVVPSTGTFIYCSEECYRSAGWGAHGDSIRLRF